MHIITFDIEDWFLVRKASALSPDTWDSFENRVEQNVEKILEILGRHNQRATFFVLGWVAEKYPLLVKKIDSAGHEIGFHSNHHEHLWLMKPDQLARDFECGISVIEDIVGKKVLFYRAPYFSLNENAEWAFELIARQGFAASSSTLAFSVLNRRVVPNEPFLLKNNNITLPEFPLNRLNLPFIKPIFSGSGYFRVLPSLVLKTLFRRSNYTNTYFHPRDFDTGIPYSEKLTPLRNMLNSIGAKSTERKLEGIFKEISFITVGEALKDTQGLGDDLPVLEL